MKNEELNKTKNSNRNAGSIGQAIGFYSFYPLLWLLSLLPFRALYVLSDILFLPLFYLLRYRRKLVRKNLRNSFPDKSDTEIRHIEKEFYHHFCDCFLETIKLPRISTEEIRKRMLFENPELAQKLLEQNRNISVYLGHYGNWEWCPGIQTYYSEVATQVNVYRRLKNPYFDRYFLKLRSHFGSKNVEKNSVFRTIVKMQKTEGRPVLLAFVADQKPSVHNIHYRTKFLNQQTPVLTGAERIARTLDHAVVYLDITKVKRGFYRAKVVLLTEHAKETPEFKITELYTRLIEQTILRNPAYWLWTHNRWKNK
jgi:KDO2-lipid IV(A) lauroyltransferase